MTLLLFGTHVPFWQSTFAQESLEASVNRQSSQNQLNQQSKNLEELYLFHVEYTMSPSE